MKYRLMIFDLDGTLLNTLEDLTDSVNYVLWKHGFKERTLEEVRGFIGNGIHKLIERSVPEGTAPFLTEECYKDFVPHYKVHCAEKTRPYDGIPELLQRLKEAGVKIAVVSNKADYAVKELCAKYFPGIFDEVVGERVGIHRKPSPDAVNEVIRLLGATKEETVYVGDSDVDVQTAENAGIDGIFVAWGFKGEAFLKEAGANVIVTRPEEIA
ncbi:MAG: HAD family hydrolase [Lachnospiraceae bacterium]|nr:HAD family hydrolase [Lachnospiraceae bacterium]